MHGQNPKRPPETGDGSTLQIVEVFPTLQGEGPYVGQPAVFVRLGGCNLACDFCDTEFEDFAATELPHLLTQINAASGDAPPPEGGGWEGDAIGTQGEVVASQSPPQPSPSRGGRIRDLVVITGGEPLRQNIAPLCAALLDMGYRVQIETNGTVFRPLPEGVDIVCSPKAVNGQYHPLRPDLLARVNALKFIISADDPAYQAVGEVGQAGTKIPVYVQPMDVYDEPRNRANLAHAAQLAQQHGYRLSLQTHKMLGIR